LDIHERQRIDFGDRPLIGTQTIAVLEKVLTRSVGVERFETEFVNQGQDALLTGAHPLSSNFNDFAVSNGMVERTSTYAVPGLDYNNVDSMGSKRSGGRQARQPCAYDYDCG
jgi:hypothetical protein